MWLNSDSMRHAMFGEPGKVTDPRLLYGSVFAAMDHVAERILVAGMSVIYDANNNKVVHRDAKRRLAKDLAVTFVLVHIQAPHRVSDERALGREVTQHQIAMTDEILEQHKRNEELPLQEETAIVIDGEAPYKEQLVSFRQQLERFVATQEYDD